MTIIYRVAWGLLGCFLGGGCAGKVTGEVDGKTPAPVLGGFWYSTYDGRDAVGIGVILSSAPSLCSRYTSLLEGQTEAYQEFIDDFDLSNLADNLMENDLDHLPRTEWTTLLTFLAENPQEMVDDFDPSDGMMSVQVCYRDDYVEWDNLLSQGSSALHTTCETGVDGAFEITHFSEEGSASGGGQVELTDGEVDIQFQVAHCPSYEEALEDYLDVSE